MENAARRTLVSFLFISIVLCIWLIKWSYSATVDAYLGIYGIVMIAYLLSKMILSMYYKPSVQTPPDVKVSVIIPSYNEKADTVLKTVQSIIDQDYPIHEIFFVDDGSQDVSGYEAMKAYKERINETLMQKGTRLIVHRLEKNSGKRHAQIWAFERAQGDVYVTVDSDGYLFPDAVRELLRPMNDPNVMATTGHINARNREDNLFTRLLDMRYDNAFRVERAAQSVTHNVLCCSGPISCYRREVIQDNLAAYGSQTFLGEPVQFGDDRCLTNYAILKGKTVYQSSARCLTDVPTTLPQFLKQQIRWNKSFYRESLNALKVGLKKPAVLVWVSLELLLWLLFGFIIIVSLLVKSVTMGWILLLYYIAYLSLSAYARNVFYILKRPLVFMMAPLYGLIHLGLLFPLRIYALLTLKSTGWGTR